MTDKELERRLRDALEHAAPNHLEGVLSRCEARKGNVIPMTKTAKTRTLGGLIAACLALALVGGGGGVFYQQTCAVASVVSLDVNPSIELKINRGEKVLSCTALNEDAQQVLSEMGGGSDLKGAKLDVAVNAIVGALVRHGYFSDISSAILISVEDKDQNRAMRLQEELTGVVGGLLQNQPSAVDVLSQTLDAGTELDRQAQANSISTGKAALVNQAIALNSGLEFEKLALLSVEELKDLIETGAPGMPIGREAACLAAEQYAGTLEVDSVTSAVDSELDDSPACYEVELHHPTLGLFKYKVDAYSGAVLSGLPNILQTGTQTPGSMGSGSTPTTPVTPVVPETPTIPVTPETPTTPTTPVTPETPTTPTTPVAPETPTTPTTPVAPETPTTPADIGLEAAKTVALNHAGLNASQITNLKTDWDWDDGCLEYEIEFWCGEVEYEYVIDGADGTILKQEQEDHTPVSSDTDSAAYIGEEAARQYALSHANCRMSDTSYCNSWLSYDDGRAECYKVEFMCGDTCYRYEIGLCDGAVLEHCHETYHHSEHHHGGHHGASRTASASTTSTASTSASPADIGEAAAKAAALGHASVSEADTRKMKVEQDWDDGRLEYEVEFEVGDTEYEYKIDGVTGAILDYEIDD